MSCENMKYSDLTYLRNTLLYERCIDIISQAKPTYQTYRLEQIKLAEKRKRNLEEEKQELKDMTRKLEEEKQNFEDMKRKFNEEKCTFEESKKKLEQENENECCKKRIGSFLKMSKAKLKRKTKY